MVEKLVKYNRLVSNKASDTEDEKAAESIGPATVCPNSAATGGKGAEADREGWSVRDLKAEKLLRFSTEAPFKLTIALNFGVTWGISVKEFLSWSQLAGGACILFGIPLLNFGRSAPVT